MTINSHHRGQYLTNYHFRLTNENYDFLYILARRGDTSLAKALNKLIEDRRQRDTTTCNSPSLPQNMEMRNYAR